MSEPEATSQPKLSLTQVEEMVQAHALAWAKDHTQLPATAFRVFLWPGQFLVKVTPGPTARIILGLQAFPGEQAFWDTLKRAILRVWHERLYSTMAVELVAHVLERDSSLKRWWKEKYNFDPELIPHMLGDEELSVRHVERIEVVHKATGLREVVEVEPGQARTTFAAKDIAKYRLARRVHEQKAAELKKDEGILPFPKTA